MMTKKSVRTFLRVGRIKYVIQTISFLTILHKVVVVCNYLFSMLIRTNLTWLQLRLSDIEYYIN